MGELSLGTIVIVLVVIWYLGKSINSILERVGTSADRRFASYEKDERVTLYKKEQKRRKELEKISSDPIYTDEEFDAIMAGKEGN